MFIQTESTPNPATMKFLPGREVLGAAGVRDFSSAEEAALSPLAERLFQVDEVSGVLLGSDFITITKSDGEWQHLKPRLLGSIMEHFTTGQPVLLESVAETVATPGDSEVIIQIKELLETRVRPAVARDGGDIVFHEFDEAAGIVYLQMRGACAGCPGATMTLKNGVENLLKHFIPEINAVEQVF